MSWRPAVTTRSSSSRLSSVICDVIRNFQWSIAPFTYTFEDINLQWRCLAQQCQHTFPLLEGGENCGKCKTRKPSMSSTDLAAVNVRCSRPFPDGLHNAHNGLNCFWGMGLGWEGMVAVKKKEQIWKTHQQKARFTFAARDCALCWNYFLSESPRLAN